MQIISSSICKFSNNIVFTKAFFDQSLYQNLNCENVENLYFFFDSALSIWVNIRRKFRFMHLSCVCHRTKFLDFESRPRSLLWLKCWWCWCWWWKKTWQKKKQKNFLLRSEKWKKQKFDDECALITEKKKCIKKINFIARNYAITSAFVNWLAIICQFLIMIFWLMLIFQLGFFNRCRIIVCVCWYVKSIIILFAIWVIILIWSWFLFANFARNFAFQCFSMIFKAIFFLSSVIRWDS